MTSRNRPPQVGARPSKDGPLPHRLSGLRSPVVWGVLLLVVIEGTVLSLFAVSYFYLRLGASAWPPPGVELPELLVPGAAQTLLLLSAVPVWLALPSLSRGRVRPLVVSLPLGIGLALAYLALKVWEYMGKGYLWTSHAYGSLDWSMTGYAGLHVGILVVAAGFVWLLARKGHFGADRLAGVQGLVIYWVYVAVGSLFLYGVQYVSPHLIRTGGLLGPPG